MPGRGRDPISTTRQPGHQSPFLAAMTALTALTGPDGHGHDGHDGAVRLSGAMCDPPSSASHHTACFQNHSAPHAASAVSYQGPRPRPRVRRRDAYCPALYTKERHATMRRARLAGCGLASVSGPVDLSRSTAGHLFSSATATVACTRSSRATTVKQPGS